MRDWPDCIATSQETDWQERLSRLKRQEVSSGWRVPPDVLLAYLLGVRLAAKSLNTFMLTGMTPEEALEKGIPLEEPDPWTLTLDWERNRTRNRALHTSYFLRGQDLFTEQSRQLFHGLVQVVSMNVPLVDSFTIAINCAEAGGPHDEIHFIYERADTGNGSHAGLHWRMRPRSAGRGRLGLCWLLERMHSLVSRHHGQMPWAQA